MRSQINEKKKGLNKSKIESENKEVFSWGC